MPTNIQMNWIKRLHRAKPGLSMGLQEGCEDKVHQICFVTGCQNKSN